MRIPDYMGNRFGLTGFLLSLLLVLFSIVLLFVIAFRALEAQHEYLNSQKQAELAAQLSRISTEFFRMLKEELPPDWAVPMPLQETHLHRIEVPNSRETKAGLLRVALNLQSVTELVSFADMAEDEGEKGFLRFLAAQRFFQARAFFQARRMCFLICASSSDYILPTGNSLKLEATLLSARAFLAEGDYESFLKRLYSLKSIPFNSSENDSIMEASKLITDKKAARWLNLLGWCRTMSRSKNLQPGKLFDKGQAVFLLRHKTGLVAYPGGQVENQLRSVFKQSGFLDPVISSNPGADASYQELEGAHGLFVRLERGNTDPISPHFLSLLALTSAGMMGLILFSMHQWRVLQRLKLLDEEENFFRQVAHDLKTPLTNVKFLAETVYLKRFKSSDQEKKYLSNLQIEVDRAVELVEQLLLAARLRKQLIQPNPVEICLEKEVEGVLSRFQTRLNGWKIVRDIQPGLFILADHKMFERVLVNLVENVLKHSPEWRLIEVKAKNQTGRDEIELIVGDPGEVFFEERVPGSRISLMKGRLPFNQEKGGSGTGLLLIRQILNVHGGDFYLEMAEKGGKRVITTWRKAENDEEDSDNRR